MFDASRILIIHQLIIQDFPSSQGLDENKVTKLFAECLYLFETQKDKSIYDFAACVSFKIARDKPFHSQNKKVAIRSAISILNEGKLEISASYSDMVSLMEDVDSNKLTLNQLSNFYKDNSSRLDL